MNRIYAVDGVGLSRRGVNEAEEDVVAPGVSQVAHRQTRQAIAEVVRLCRTDCPCMADHKTGRVIPLITDWRIRKLLRVQETYRLLVVLVRPTEHQLLCA